MAASSSNPKDFHGEFSAPVSIYHEYDEDGKLVIVDIINRPKSKGPSASSSSTSLTESEKTFKRKEMSSPERSESETEPEDVKIKKEKVSPEKAPMKDIFMHDPHFSALLYAESYHKFVMRADRFMIEFGKECHPKTNGGILSGQTCARLIKILIAEQEDDKLDIPLFDLFMPLQNYHKSIHYFIDMLDINKGNCNLFKQNYDMRNEEIWYTTLPFDLNNQNEDQMLQSFNHFYLHHVVQVVNRMLICKKLRTHTISGRYIMRCVFFVVKLMLFPNINTPETYMQLQDTVKGKEFELKFLGRNAWLRQAWTLFQSIVKYEEKIVLYPDTKNIDNALSIQELILCYNEIIRHFEENFALDSDAFKDSATSISKKAAEFRSIIGVIHCTLYCYDIYSLLTRYTKKGAVYRVDTDIYYRITHAPWLWPKYRGDLEQTEITEKTLTTIDFTDYKSLYDDSKHLHSFRSSRTFGVRLPEKYFRMYDSQDVTASVRSDTGLGNLCLDVATQFGIYDAYNADLSKTQAQVNDMRDILYVKMTDLRNKISESISNYISIKSNNEIPDFQSRATIYDLSTDDTEETIQRTKWIKLDSDDPFGVLIRLDMQESAEGAVDGNIMTKTRIDTNIKNQIRKSVYIDTLMSDIQIAQSLLRYLEQLYGTYYPESKRFF